MMLKDITMAEFKRRLKKTKTLVVPYWTVEAHGAHLPSSADMPDKIVMPARQFEKVK